MKKMSIAFNALFVSVLLLTSQMASGQVLKAFFSGTDVPLTYLGIDFTLAKVLNEPVITAADIKNRHYAGMNGVVVSEKEAKKWDLGKFFNKTDVTKDISIVTEKNEKIDETKIMGTGTDDLRLKKGDVENLVKGYKIAGKKGVGVLFVMETMNKLSETGSMYVTFIDMSNGKMLMTERMTAKPAGFGFRNYWVKTVFVVLEEIKKSKMQEWKQANG